MRHRIVVAGIVLGLASPAGAAQAPLTLAEALSAALTRNPNLQASAQRQRSAAALEEAARSPMRPSVALSAQPGYAQGLSSSSLSAGASLTASWLLWDGHVAETNLAIAHQQSSVAQLQLDQARLDTQLAVGTAFLAVSRAEGLERVLAQTLAQAQDHLKLGQARLTAGTATRAEVLQLQAQLAAAQGNALQARQAVRSARLALSALLDWPLGDRVLATPSLSLRPTPGPDEVRERLARRPELAIQRERIELDRLRGVAEGRATWPTLSAAGRLSSTGVPAPQAYLGLSANWNLYEGGRAGARAESAEYDLAAERAMLAGLELSADQDVQDALQQRELAQARLPIARQALLAAQEAYRLARQRYEVGLATPLELTDVQNTLLTAQNQLVNAEIDLSLAELRLRRALSEDVSAAVSP